MFINRSLLSTDSAALVREAIKARNGSFKKIVRLDLKTAEEWLDKNQNIRRLNKNRVENYYRQKKDGNWQPLFECPFMFDLEEFLRNGQHRLSAFIKLAKEVPGYYEDVEVIFNATEDMIKAVDGTYNRTTSQKLGAPKGHVPIINCIRKYSGMDKAKQADNVFVVEKWLQHYDAAIDLAMKIDPFKPHNDAVTMAVLVRAIDADENLQLIESFTKLLRFSTDVTATGNQRQTVATLHKWLTANPSISGEKIRQRRTNVIIHALKKFLADEECHQMREYDKAIWHPAANLPG